PFAAFEELAEIPWGKACDARHRRQAERLGKVPMEIHDRSAKIAIARRVYRALGGVDQIGNRAAVGRKELAQRGGVARFALQRPVHAGASFLVERASRSERAGRLFEAGVQVRASELESVTAIDRDRLDVTFELGPEGPGVFLAGRGKLLAQLPNGRQRSFCAA